jgi:hypothetical protein
MNIASKIISAIYFLMATFYFFIINFKGIIQILIFRNNPDKMISILRNIVNRKYNNSLVKSISELFREILCSEYSIYIKKTTEYIPKKIIESRPIIKESLFHNLILYRNEKGGKALRYDLSMRIYRCYQLLSKRELAIKYLEKLHQEYPEDRELNLLLKYEKKLLKFDKNMDKIEIEANPEKYPEKYRKLQEYIYSECLPRTKTGQIIVNKHMLDE